MKFVLPFIIIFFFGFLVTPKTVFAGCSYLPCPDAACCSSAGGTWTPDSIVPGGNSSNAPGVSSGATVTLPNPIGVNDPRVIIGNIIKVSLGLVGSVALLLFIYGGLMMMTAAGNSDRVSKGRNTLVWAAIGLIVIFGSYALVNFLLQSVAAFKSAT